MRKATSGSAPHRPIHDITWGQNQLCARSTMCANLDVRGAELCNPVCKPRSPFTLLQDTTRSSALNNKRTGGEQQARSKFKQIHHVETELDAIRKARSRKSARWTERRPGTRSRRGARPEKRTASTRRRTVDSFRLRRPSER